LVVVELVDVKENANYWSSSHTMGMEMPLGAATGL
jgi:hypothetical protein